MLPLIYRQAAKILQAVRGNKKMSVKSLALEKHVQKKRQTYALVMETLRYSAVLDEIIARAGLLKEHRDWWEDMIKILVYDLVIGKGLPHHGLCGEVQKYKRKLLAALKKVKKRKKATETTDLLPKQKRVKVLPRYVRVNTLKVSVADVIESFKSAGWEFRPKGSVPMFDRWKKAKEAERKREEQQKRQAKRKTKHSRWRKRRRDDPGKSEPEAEQQDDEEAETEEKPPESKGIFFLDQHVRHLLVFPPNTRMHDHPMVKRGELVLQDKASCLPAYVLLHHLSLDTKLDCRGMPPDKLVMRAVMEGGAAPGNKSSCLAAIGNNSIKVFAVEKNPKRMRLMKERLRFFGCEKVESLEKDFLDLSPANWKSIKAVLLDPSCTGSGIVNRPEVHQKRKKRRRVNAFPRQQSHGTKKALDTADGDEHDKDEGEADKTSKTGSEALSEAGPHVDPDGNSEGEQDSDHQDEESESQGEEPDVADNGGEEEGEGVPDGEPAGRPKKDTVSPQVLRIRKLAAFQKKMLRHALSFPNVDRVVYSTCSIHEEENERVIQSVMTDPEITKTFKLVNIMPKQWRTRARPLFENSQYCIRCEPTEDFTNGFFVACIERIRSKERKWEEWKSKRQEKVPKGASAKRKADEAFDDEEAEADAGDLEDVLDKETLQLARKLGQLPEKRFRADPKDPANHPKVEYKTRQKCTICLVRGHFSRDCPHRMCTVCHIRGHRPEDCTKRGTEAGETAMANKDGTLVKNMAGLVKDTYGMDYKTLRKKLKEKPQKKTKTHHEEKTERRKRLRTDRKVNRKGSIYSKSKPQRKFANKLKRSGGKRR